MALTATAAGSGAATGAAATLAFDCGATFAVGDTIVVVVSCDNAGTSGAASIAGVTDAVGNVYIRRASRNNDTGNASNGNTLEVYVALCEVALGSTDDITVSFSPNTAGRTAVVWKLTAASGSYARFVEENGSVAAATANASVSPTNNPTNGDCIIGAHSYESNAAVTGDSDTTNGSWSSAHQTVADTGIASGSMRCFSQAKVVNATGAQTWNVTHASGDRSISILTFRETTLNGITRQSRGSGEHGPASQATHTVSSSSFTPSAGNVVVCLVGGFCASNPTWTPSDSFGDSGGTSWAQADVIETTNSVGYHQETAIWWRRIGTGAGASTITCARTSPGGTVDGWIAAAFWQLSASGTIGVGLTDDGSKSGTSGTTIALDLGSSPTSTSLVASVMFQYTGLAGVVDTDALQINYVSDATGDDQELKTCYVPGAAVQTLDWSGLSLSQAYTIANAVMVEFTVSTGTNVAATQATAAAAAQTASTKVEPTSGAASASAAAQAATISTGTSASASAASGSASALDATVRSVVASWNSWDVEIDPTSAVATVAKDGGGIVADVRLYESTDDNGVAESGLLPDYTTTSPHAADAHWDETVGIWYRSSGPAWDKPAVGKSDVARGSRVDESGTPSPTGVYDLLMHPPNSEKLTVAAFVAPVGGHYYVKNLAARRATPWGTGDCEFKVFDESASLIATVQTGLGGSVDPAWHVDSATYDLGVLAQGDRIHFAVDYDGSPDNDSTEVVWTVELTEATVVDVDEANAQADALNATVEVDEGSTDDQADPATATGSATAGGATTQVAPTSTAAAATAAAQAATVTTATSATAGSASATGAAQQATVTTAASASATAATGSATGQSATTRVAPGSQAATGAVTAGTASTKIDPSGGAATASGAAGGATAALRVSPTAASGSATALDADPTTETVTTASPTAATATGAAGTASATVAPVVGSAAATAAAQNASVQTTGNDIAPAEAAGSTGSALGATTRVAPVVGVATATASGLNATVSTAQQSSASAQTATATAAGLDARLTIAPSIGSGTGSGSAGGPQSSIKPTSLAATGSGTAGNASIVTSTVVTASTAEATATVPTASLLLQLTAQAAAGIGSAFGASVEALDPTTVWCIAVDLVADACSVSLDTDAATVDLVADSCSTGVAADDIATTLAADEVSVAVALCE